MSSKKTTHPLLQPLPKTVELLLSPLEIRRKAEFIFEKAQAGESYFELSLSRVQALSDRVVEVCKKNYPDLKIPFHSRWGHFLAGEKPGQKVNRLTQLYSKLDIDGSATDKVKSLYDLVIFSVLMDAGAGMAWRYREESTDFSIGRSEGLAVASFHAFMSGKLSSDESRPYSIDAQAIESLEFETFQEFFQVSNQNPLLGCEGRFQLLKSLAKALRGKPEFFGTDSRPGGLVDCLVALNEEQGQVKARDILKLIQLSLGSIWPSRLVLDHIPLGDVWMHPKFSRTIEEAIPFHKLSQWLSYSLMEPLLFLKPAIQVTDIDELTGLPEYRNGGLFIDGEVLRLKDPALLSVAHEASSPLIIEWRALTLSLLDRVAPLVRSRLNLPHLEMVRILEGGTWATGRELAKEKRSDGSPPLQLLSDGTVF